MAGLIIESHVVDVWFRLYRQMLDKGMPQGPTALRPPSLRDAAYAYALAVRKAGETDEETIEAFVNGLEMGALSALRVAWERKKRPDVQGPGEDL